MANFIPHLLVRTVARCAAGAFAFLVILHPPLASAQSSPSADPLVSGLRLASPSRSAWMTSSPLAPSWSARARITDTLESTIQSAVLADFAKRRIDARENRIAWRPSESV
jgi:hypothetical protein